MSDDELIHEIAVALNNDGAYCGDCDYEGGLSCPDCKRVCEGYARNVVLPRIRAAKAGALEEGASLIEANYSPIRGDEGPSAEDEVYHHAATILRGRVAALRSGELP